MEFVVQKDVLGSSAHILCRDDGSLEETTNTSGLLVVGSKEFDDVESSFAVTLPEFPPENYIKPHLATSTVTATQRVPWRLCIPQKAYRRFVESYIQNVREQLLGIDLSYLEVLKRSNSVFGELQPAKVRGGSGDDPILRTFSGDGSGYASVPVYDRRTVTGRCRVVEGPNILLLKKEHRTVVESRFGDTGSVVSLDFRSLEPRVLLNVSSVEPNQREGLDREDIYQQIKDSVFSTHRVTREQVKQVVLSEVFGAGQDLLRSKLLNISDADTVIEAISGWFRIPEIKDRLVREANSNGKRWITNLYGRRVSVGDTAPYTYINRLVQSTAVDVALHGFASVVDYIKDLGRTDTVVPLFVLHDALILDVHNEARHLLPTLCKVGSVDIPRFETVRFWLKSGSF